MNPERARQILRGHAFVLEDVQHPLMQESFLLSLRSYKGLKREKCVQIEAAFRTLAPELAGESVDRQTIGALWSILWSIRNWALHPQGMLRRNNLMAPEDVEWLDNWVAKMDLSVCLLLEGNSVESVFGEMDAC